MGYPTPIEWTDATWNPIGGCSIASPGCAPCYAQRLAGTRLKSHPLYKGTTKIVKGKPVFNGKLTAAPYGHPVWTWPLRWRGAKQRKLGRGMPSLIFVGDMSDLYHKDRARSVQDRVLAAILHSPHLGQLLTKRPDEMADHIEELRRERRPGWRLGFEHLEHVMKLGLWLGMSAERQKEFDQRWPHLRRLAAMGFVVFVSYEPALGPLVLPDDFLALGRRAQVIAGGMSGEDYAPVHPDWFRAVRDQCEATGVAFFFKQWGEYAPSISAFSDAEPDIWVSTDGRARNEAEALKGGTWKGMFRVGKKAAGRLLDGREYNGFPAIAAA